MELCGFDPAAADDVIDYGARALRSAHLASGNGPAHVYVVHPGREGGLERHEADPDPGPRTESPGAPIRTMIG